MLAQFDMLHVIAGALVGLLVGLTGVGGGSLMTPLLVLMFGISPTTAVGTDLLFASSTKIAGSLIHGSRSSVDWKIVRRLASGSVPAAILTLIVVSGLGQPPKAASKVMLVALGCMLILTAFATLFQNRLASFAQHHEQRDDKTTRLPTIVLGALLGVAVTVSSVGAGAIGVTALLMLYPASRVSRIVGSDIAHAVPLTLIAGFGHWVIGDVNVPLLVNLLIGSVPAVAVGSLLSTRASDRVLRPILAAVLLISGYKLLG
ncbi:protein of hypothetical protein function DUF81 [Novosphingobium nitrogenifigens DSM 19370]|uniref:Probable membrane transporter protein n=1 Tax=Novosphingobium nitrogenifigens DSM 19370 TaxID=983920 RepID=F1ZDD4_9SPHN|nr:sulfite exporter TauE/SafE family protein [Novosphingobium nitrogenifigens]EGD57424.1 protein of hypothetical protein function DUF81 [Novosphingobium nitrogenifigens DSM 19370]